MEYQVILITSRSVTIEIKNHEKYYCNKEYNVLLNGEVVLENQKKNVVSLFGLNPNTEYEVTVQTEENNYSNKFTTEAESATVNVREFGAFGDGQQDDTNAIQAAILSCPKNGRVLIPLGIYYVKPIFLKSDITIEFEKGATLLGHIDRSAYPILPGRFNNDEVREYYLGTWEGQPEPCHASLITGIGVENVKIVGQGILDGNASNSTWWNNIQVKIRAWRPRTFFLNGCKGVTVQGMTIKNSPSWTVHPYFSEDLKFIDLFISNPADSPNTDGLDPESCNNLEIIGVHISVGDDCIAIKSGKLYPGQTVYKKSENITIRNCYMERGHGAVVLGSEISGGVANIFVQQCIFEDTDRGLRIKTRRGRGKHSVIEEVTFKNIYMKGVLTPFVANMFYHCCDPDGKTEYVWSKECLTVDDRTPYLGSFYFKDIVCEDAHVAAGFFYGLPERKIKRVDFENVKVSFAKDAIKGYPAMMCKIPQVAKMGIFVNNIETVSLKNIELTGYEGEEVIIDNVGEYIKE